MATAMASVLLAHAGAGALEVGSGMYADYRKAANEGNGIILFKNRSKEAVWVYAYNAGALIKLTTQFTAHIPAGKVGKVVLPNPLPLVSNNHFALYVNK